MAVARDADVEGRATGRSSEIAVLALTATIALAEFQGVDVAGDQAVVRGVIRQALVDAQLGIDPDRLAQVTAGPNENRALAAELDGAA